MNPRITKVFFASMLVVFAILGQGLPALQAEALSYDRYAPVFETESSSSSSLKKAAQHFLVYPFEIVKWPVDKTLVYVEKHYIYEKVRWIYDTLDENGFTPRGSIVSLTGLGGGADFDLLRIAKQKENYPDMNLQSWVDWTRSVIFETGARTGWERIADTGAHVRGFFKYENRPEEHFYGIGPDTSKGEGTSYRMEATTLEAVAGYTWSPQLSTDAKFGFRNINITNGEDGGRGEIDRTFAPQTIPGLDGDELITLAWEIKRDTRDSNENSIRGGLQRVGFSFNEGLGNSEAKYFKYDLESSRYFRLGSDRRVLALRFYGEYNSQTENHTVPFHQMAKLGGYGAYPRLSETLRGYGFNRFFDNCAALLNIEYRYTVWQYRDIKMDAVLFWDQGEVFEKLSMFRFKDLRESYGLGARVSIANRVFFSTELAHSDEGTELYVKSGTPF